MSNNKQHSPFYNVLRRELQRMVSRRCGFGIRIMMRDTESRNSFDLAGQFAG